MPLANKPHYVTKNGAFGCGHKHRTAQSARGCREPSSILEVHYRTIDALSAAHLVEERSKPDEYENRLTMCDCP